MATKRARKDDGVLRIGWQMSNVMYNLAQRGDGVSNIHIAAADYKFFSELQQQWDLEVAKYRGGRKTKKREATHARD